MKNSKLGLELANLAYGNRVGLFGLIRLVRGFRPFRFRFFSCGKTSSLGTRHMFGPSTVRFRNNLHIY